MNGEQASVEKRFRATRRGGTIDCQVSASNLNSADGHNAGVILLMDEQETPSPAV